MLCYLCNFTLIAQPQLVSTIDEFENFDYNIKQIDEFMLRFNLKELLIQPTQSATWENDNRVLLFDKLYYRQNEEVLNTFINEVKKQQVALHFQDSTWFAIAECDVVFKGKKDKITLKLRTEQVKDNIYKWSIVSAAGTILDLKPKTQSSNLKILPTDNEVNFISLQSVTTTNAPNITLFSKNGYEVDRLSAFNCLVYNKLLEIKTVNSLTYCFTQVSGYKMYVKKFVREEKNAGWLIYKVEKDDNSITSNGNDKRNTIQQTIELFYKTLSDYAKSPENITLARNIKNMFVIDQSEPYIFGAMHIYNDIDAYVKKYRSPTPPYISITEYLNSVENISKQGVILSYSISDFALLNNTNNTTIATYRLSVLDGHNINYEYDTKATLKDGKIQNIIPLKDNKSDKGNNTSVNALIRDYSIVHNISKETWNGYSYVPVNCVQIHSHIEVCGNKGKQIKLCAFFYNADGTKAQSSVPQYQTGEGQATIQSTIYCTYENTEWKDYKLDMPYYALPAGQLKVKIQVQDIDGNILAESSEKEFTVYK